MMDAFHFDDPRMAGPGIDTTTQLFPNVFSRGPIAHRFLRRLIGGRRMTTARRRP